MFEYLQSNDKENIVTWKLPDELMVCHCKALWQHTWTSQQQQQRNI